MEMTQVKICGERKKHLRRIMFDYVKKKNNVQNMKI